MQAGTVPALKMDRVAPEQKPTWIPGQMPGKTVVPNDFGAVMPLSSGARASFASVFWARKE